MGQTEHVQPLLNGEVRKQEITHHVTFHDNDSSAKCNMTEHNAITQDPAALLKIGEPITQY